MWIDSNLLKKFSFTSLLKQLLSVNILIIVHHISTLIFVYFTPLLSSASLRIYLFGSILSTLFYYNKLNSILIFRAIILLIVLGLFGSNFLGWNNLIILTIPFMHLSIEFVQSFAVNRTKYYLLFSIILTAFSLFLDDRIIYLKVIILIFYFFDTIEIRSVNLRKSLRHVLITSSIYYITMYMTTILVDDNGKDLYVMVQLCLVAILKYDDFKIRNVFFEKYDVKKHLFYLMILCYTMILFLFYLDFRILLLLAPTSLLIYYIYSPNR